MGQSPTSGAFRAGPAPSQTAAGDDLAGFPATALGRFPGAAVIVGANGVVLDANPTGEPIAALLRGGEGDELRQAIAGAQQGRPGQVNPLLLNAQSGIAGQAFDVAVLPWGEAATVLVLGRDITLERSLRAALIESRQLFKDLVEAASDFAWETDAQGRFTFLSGNNAMGYSAAELIGASSRMLEDTGAGTDGGESPFTTRTPVQDAEIWVRGQDGEPACLLATALPLFNADAEWRGARGLCRDITADRQHKARLAVDRHRERLLAYILGILRDEMDPDRVLSAACGALVPALPATGAAIYRQDPQGDLVCAAQAGDLPGPAELSGLIGRAVQGESEVEIQLDGGLLFGLATHFEDSWNGFLCLWQAEAGESWGREDRGLLAEVAGQIGLTNRQLARQEELEELSATDPLTGLHNRRSFLSELERRFSRRAAWRGGAGLFFIDLDNFKAVNDRHGHQQGDLALVTVARILREQTRSRDLVARLGGDEFAVLVEDIGQSASEHKAREFQAASGELSSLSGDEAHPLGFSVGVAYCRAEEDEIASDAVERADQAMYQVKRRGKGGVEISVRPAPEDLT